MLTEAWRNTNCLNRLVELVDKGPLSIRLRPTLVWCDAIDCVGANVINSGAHWPERRDILVCRNTLCACFELR